jgi:uncharacterized protein YlxW (UPF0749 family)
MCQRLCALLLLCCFSCSSLPVAPLPDTFIEEKTPPENTKSTEQLLNDIAKLRQELENLRLIFQTLKGNSQALASLSDSFEARLQNLQNKLTAAQLESSGLQESLTKLKTEFEDYRAEVQRSRIRNGLIIGGIGVAGGLIFGLFIGLNIH